MHAKQVLEKKLIESQRFVYFVINRFFEDDCAYRASALTFATILAIVPLMSVVFTILSSFPVFDHFIGPVESFIFENFVPATGKAMQNYLLQFTTQASKWSGLGIVFLFAMALLVMYTIESSMNRIWRVGSSRHGISAFLLYWAILSLAPFILGLSLAASTYFFSLPLIREYNSASFFLNYFPFVLSLLGFMFLYIVVPNCPVRTLHAAYGALFSASLFELAKRAFTFYLNQFNAYQLLFGAFAVLPIFFIWVYWVWLITLLGAEICYALSVHYQRRQGLPLDGFSHALLWLNYLWKAQQEGKGVSLEKLIDASDRPFEIDIGVMLTQLIELKLMKTTRDGQYLLSQDLTNITLYELTKLLPYGLPSAKELVHGNSPMATKCLTHLNKANAKLKEVLMISLDELFSEDHKI